MRIQVGAAVLATAVSCGTVATGAAAWRTSVQPPDPACLEKDVATGIIGVWDAAGSGHHSLLDFTEAMTDNDGPCDWKLPDGTSTVTKVEHTSRGGATIFVNVSSDVRQFEHKGNNSSTTKRRRLQCAGCEITLGADCSSTLSSTLDPVSYYHDTTQVLSWFPFRTRYCTGADTSSGCTPWAVSHWKTIFIDQGQTQTITAWCGYFPTALARIKTKRYHFRRYQQTSVALKRTLTTQWYKNDIQQVVNSHTSFHLAPLYQSWVVTCLWQTTVSFS
jgi:hypothetical protein